MLQNEIVMDIQLVDSLGYNVVCTNKSTFQNFLEINIYQMIRIELIIAQKLYMFEFK